MCPDAMFEGRNAKTIIKELLEAAETKEAELLVVEIIALRLASATTCLTMPSTTPS